MDDWGFGQLEPWLQERQTMPVGPLFCVHRDRPRPPPADEPRQHGTRPRAPADCRGLQRLVVREPLPLVHNLGTLAEPPRHNHTAGRQLSRSPAASPEGRDYLAAMAAAANFAWATAA
jgi:hypothetical protein